MRFYTLPPRVIKYPYLFTTMLRWRELLDRDFEHAIVDAGVEYFFLVRKLRDYPRHYLIEYERRARLLGKLFGDRVWVAIPDYPDDYQPGLTHENGMDNVDKTLRNVARFVQIDGVAWIPVIQSRYMNTFSFLESCERLREIVGDYPRVGIGTVCKARKVSWIAYCLKTARAHFYNSWIHAFGLTLTALRKLGGDTINSFDSMAWDWYRSWAVKYPLDPNRSKFTGKNWRIEAPRIYAKLPSRWPSSTRAQAAYFLAYLKRISELTGEDIVSLADW